MQPQPIQVKKEKKGLSKPIMVLLVGAGCVFLAIPVLGIVAAIAVPMYSRFQQRAQAATIIKHQKAFSIQARGIQLESGTFPVEVNTEDDLVRISGLILPESISSFGYEGTVGSMVLTYQYRDAVGNEQWITYKLQREGDLFREEISCSDENMGLDNEGTLPINDLGSASSKPGTSL